MTRLLLAVPSVFLFLSPAAVADGGQQAYSCEPALPVFCRNIHVSCAGATKIRTAVFEVLISGTDARVTFVGAATAIQARVSHGRDLVIRLHDSRDWIRIQRDNRFSHRIYRKRGAAMSYGTCARRLD